MPENKEFIHIKDRDKVVAYCVDYMLGCGCTSGLTLVFRKEDKK